MLIESHCSNLTNGYYCEKWTYCSEASWSFNALQRAVESLPRDIYRAKGIVRLDLDNGDYGILQVTGKRAWLKLTEPESPETV